MDEQEKKYKVWLLDDDRFLLNMYVNKFAKLGHETEAFFGGNDILEKLRDDSSPKPDIIVLDIVMPNMDGLEILERIKKEGLAPSSILVMLTNQAESADIEKAKKLGVDGYIVKATSIPSEVVDTVLKIAEDKYQG